MITENGDGFIVDYSDLTPGSPAGDEKVIVCSKCGRPGIRWRHTKQVAHIVHYRKEGASQKERCRTVLSCKGAYQPPASEPPSNLGFPWCPREMLWGA